MKEKQQAQLWDIPPHRILFAEPKRAPYCVVIPVINEGIRLHHLLDRMVEENISKMADIVIVDAGSQDGSLMEAVLKEKGVAVLLQKTGPGLSAQLRVAYAYALKAGYAGVITIDGNNKDDPEAIPRFITALDEGYDFVQASRFLPGGRAENTPLLRHLAIRLLHAPLLSLASGFTWTDSTQGFRAYSQRLLSDPRLAIFRSCFRTYELLPYLSYRAPLLGFRCIELPTIRRYPATGIPTKIRGWRSLVRLFAILLWACLGGYDPPHKREIG